MVDDDMEEIFALLEDIECTTGNGAHSESFQTYVDDKFFEGVEKILEEHVEPMITNRVVENSHNNGFVHDVPPTEMGQLKLQCCLDSFFSSSSSTQASKCQTSETYSSLEPKKKVVKRRKGNPWTKEEHERFLMGLERFGKGDWKGISRFAVVTRTPTQVASHAQKFFLRHTSVKNGRKRRSIFDITSASKKHSFVAPLIHQNWNYPPSAGHIPQSLAKQLTGGSAHMFDY